MLKVVGVNFKDKGRTYFFNPNKLNLHLGDKVIVETSMGKELGKVKIVGREIDETRLKDPLKNVIKIATKEDIKHEEQNERLEKEAFDICNKKVEEYGLEMKLVEAKYLFDNSKLIFYFTAENRVDFRELVKELASIFRTRIELRQISTREQVKRLGGNGICGRELCCCSYLKDIVCPPIKAVREQNLSLNASKILGSCGRLMCCLNYEQNVYEEKLKHLPHVGAIVKTEDGEGVVDAVEVLKENVKVKLKDEEGNFYFKKYEAKDIKIIKDAKNNPSDKKQKDEETKELEKAEELDKKDKKNIKNDNDI